MFSHLDILYENLLDRLGGREMLELMIAADDFAYIHYNKQGLQFTFKVPYDDKLRLAKFIPMATGSTSDAYFAPQKYQIKLTVEALSNGSFVTIKPYHDMTLSHPDRLVNVFEAMTKVAVTFC